MTILTTRPYVRHMYYVCIHPYTRVTWRGQAKGFAGKGPQRGSLGYAGVQWRDVRAIFKT